MGDESGIPPITEPTVSTAVSHFLLAGTGICCWHYLGFNYFSYTQGCFSIISINSVMGLLYHGLKENGEKLKGAYEITTFLETIFALPCITTTMWIRYNLMWELAVAHTAVSVIPLIAYFLDNKLSGKLIDVIVGINAISLGIVSGMNKNWYSLGAAALFALSHFYFQNEGVKNVDLPSRDVYNYGTCIFGALAFYGLRYASPLI